MARWQIASRLLPGSAITVPLTDRARLLVSRGMYGATQNIYCGLNDFEDMSFLVHCLRPGDLFFDVGANVGVYTVLASAAAGASTLAFEPSPAALDSLRANVALNHLETLVEVAPVAVSRSCGEVAFVLEGASAMHRVASAGSPQAATVPLRSLDSCGLAPAVIKIDVEGYEAEVLGGAEETLDRPQLLAVLAEVNDDSRHYGGGPEDAGAMLSRRGFQPVTYDPRRRTLEPKRTRSDNALFVRDLAEARRRVREAEPFRVFGERI